MADLYYIEEGYYDSGYFVYTADAASALASEFAVSCDASVIGAVTEASAALSSTSTFSAIGSKLLEASAEFTGAFAPTLTVEVLKNSFAVLDVPVTLTATPTINRSITQALDTIASLNAMAEKFGGSSFTLETDTVLTALAFRTQNTSAELNSTATVSATANLYKSSPASLESTTTVDVTYTRIISSAAELVIESSLSCEIGVIKPFDISLASPTELSVEYTRIPTVTIDISSAFAPTLTAVAQLAGVALCEVSTVLEATVSKTTGYSATIESTSSASLTATRIFELSSDLVSEFAVTVAVDHFVGVSADIASDTALVADNNRTRATEASMASTVSLSADTDNSRIRGFDSSLTADNEISAIISPTRDLIATTLATESTLTAIAFRVQPSSADLVTDFTATTDAVKTTDTGSNIATEFTQTVEPNATFGPSFNFDSAFTPTVTAVVSVDRGSDMSVTATVTALVGVIKQFAPNQNFGVRSGTVPVRLELDGLPFFGLKWYDPGFTVSIWARRETTNTFSTLWTYFNPASGTEALYAFVIDNNNVRLRNNYDADEPGATWNNVAPVDTEWHQYILQCYKPNHWKLWIDGVYKGLEQHYAYMEGAVWSNNGYIQLGSGLDRRNGQQYDEAATTDANLDFAQIWAGIVPRRPLEPSGSIVTDAFSITPFYDGGYIDLGDNGRGQFNRLPAPYIYNRLSGEYTYDLDSGYGSPKTVPPAVEPLGIPFARASSNLTGNAEIVLVISGNLTANFTLTARIGYVVDITRELSADVALTGTAFTIKVTDSALDAEFTQTSTAYRIQPGASDLDANFTQSAVIGVIKQFASDLSTEFTLTCEGTEIQAIQASADLVSEFTLTADVNETQSFTSTPNSEFTLTCEATLKPPIRITADLSTEFTVTTELTKVLPFGSTMSSEFTVFADTTKIKGAVANLTSDASLYALSGLQIQAAAALEVQAFKLTQGDVLNLAPELTLYVPAESRTRLVRPENRIYAIEGETRTRQVLAESRIITIEQQTEVNII